MQKVGHLVFFSRACAALVLWLFAVPALMMIFMMAQAPLLIRHQLPEDAPLADD